MPSNALDYITVSGFKSIASVEKLPLKPVNVLIGSNGSGKSNFISVFAFLHIIREVRLRDYVTEAGGAEKVLHFGSKTTKQIQIHISFESEVNQYELALSPTRDDGLYPSSERAFFWNKSLYPNKPFALPITWCEPASEAGGFITSTTRARPHPYERRQKWTTIGFSSLTDQTLPLSSTTSEKSKRPHTA